LQIFKIIDLFENEKRYLIDYANIKQGLISYQKDFLGEKGINKYFKHISIGFPLVLPLGLKCFDYDGVKEIFKIDTKNVFSYIFKTKNLDYKPALRFLNHGNFFCVGAKPKKKYYNLIKFIISHNKKLKKYITDLQEKKMIVSAFQTRNIPHSGHEEIIKQLLNKSNHVIVNPVIGTKKIGDINYNFLKKFTIFLSTKNIKIKLVIFL